MTQWAAAHLTSSLTEIGKLDEARAFVNRIDPDMERQEMGLDARALLLGAAAMTSRFLEEPFERNPVLQFAAVNYLKDGSIGRHFAAARLAARQLAVIGEERFFD